MRGVCPVFESSFDARQRSSCRGPTNGTDRYLVSRIRNIYRERRERGRRRLCDDVGARFVEFLRISPRVSHAVRSYPLDTVASYSKRMRCERNTNERIHSSPSIQDGSANRSCQSVSGVPRCTRPWYVPLPGYRLPRMSLPFHTSAVVSGPNHGVASRSSASAPADSLSGYGRGGRENGMGMGTRRVLSSVRCSDGSADDHGTKWTRSGTRLNSGSRADPDSSAGVASSVQDQPYHGLRRYASSYLGRSTMPISKLKIRRSVAPYFLELTASPSAALLQLLLVRKTHGSRMEPSISA